MEKKKLKKGDRVHYKPMPMSRKKKKQINFKGFYYPLSLVAIVIGTSFIIGWKSWLLDLYGTLILVCGVLLNFICYFVNYINYIKIMFKIKK